MRRREGGPRVESIRFTFHEPTTYREIDILGSPSGPITAPLLVRGDCNADGGIDVSDALRALGFAFLGRWLACQDESLLQRMLEIKHFLSICGSQADEILSQVALRNADELQQQSRELISHNLAGFEALLEPANAKLHWIVPQAGCVAFPQITSDMTGRDFAQRLLKETGINIVPGDVFCGEQQHFRLGFGQPDFSDHVERLLEVLA